MQNIKAQEEQQSNRVEPNSTWKNESSVTSYERGRKFIADEDYPKAFAHYSKLVDRFKLPYEKSQALYGLVQVLMTQEKYPEAITAIEQVIEINKLPNRDHFHLMFTLAQLHLIEQDTRQALRWIDTWLADSGQIKAEVHILKASILAGEERFREAMLSINRGIELNTSVKKDWQQLKLSLHYELHEFVQCQAMLEFMIRHWPEDQRLWKQLASVALTLKDDDYALAIYGLAHRKGFLDNEAELMQLVSLYATQSMPYWSAKTLQEGIDQGIIKPTEKNYQQLGQTWAIAQENENAVDALRIAAEQSQGGKIHAQLVFLMADQENWDAAIIHAQSALSKGGIKNKDIGQMHEMIGISNFELGKFDLARRSFLLAMDSSESAQSSQQWLVLIDDRDKQRTKVVQ